MINACLVGQRYDASIYKDPAQFLPERWLRGTGKDVHPFAFLPFGFGPRACIGEQNVVLNRMCQFLHALFVTYSIVVFCGILAVSIKLVPFTNRVYSVRNAFSVLVVLFIASVYLTPYVSFNPLLFTQQENISGKSVSEQLCSRIRASNYL